MKGFNKEDYYRMLEVFQRTANREPSQAEIAEIDGMFAEAKKMTAEEQKRTLNHFAK